MALSADEQKLFDFAKSALPAWVRSDDEFLLGCAKMFGSVKAMIDYFFGQTLISEAVGATATTPDWLNQHARDRDTSRQYTEGDPALRTRIRIVSDALTPASIVAAAQAILVAEGIAGTVGLVELPRDGAHSGTYTAMSGTGGEFTAPNGAGSQRFAPSAGWATPPVDSTHTGRPWNSWILTTTGAANPLNDLAGVAIDGTDGTPATDLVDNFAAFSNVVGVAAVDAGVTWTANKLINPPYVADGFSRAYSRRGYRSARARPLAIVLILPYGSTAATESSCREMLRQKKAAGVVGKIERRLVP